MASALLRRRTQRLVTLRRHLTMGHPSIVAVIEGTQVLVSENVARESHIATPGTFQQQSGDLTGLRVWEAAPYLIRHMERNPECIRGKAVIDLGSGTGAVGLSAAAIGAEHVVLSDADSAATISTDLGWQERSTLETLALNVALNSAHVQAAVGVEALCWGDSSQIAALLQRHPRGFSAVLLSDLLYYKPEETYDTLAATIRALAAADARVILSYRVRHGMEHTFVDLLTKGGTVVDAAAAAAAAAAADAASSRAPPPMFEIVYTNAANEASLSEASHATRLVELRRIGS